jgi:hypothetical protein
LLKELTAAQAETVLLRRRTGNRMPAMQSRKCGPTSFTRRRTSSKSPAHAWEGSIPDPASERLTTVGSPRSDVKQDGLKRRGLEEFLNPPHGDFGRLSSGTRREFKIGRIEQDHFVNVNHIATR